MNGLLHEVLRGNPGLGVPDGSWVDAEISKILAVDFQRYIQFADPKAYRELAAMWIVAAKDGSGREYWISPDCKFPTFFSWALCPYEVVIKPDLLTLVKRANRWLADMRKEVPFWQDYPDFDKKTAELSPFKGGPASAKLMELPIGARLHFFTALSHGLGSLADLTDYKLRSFGLYIPQSVRLLLGTQLLVAATNVDSVIRSLSKGELVCECDRLGIPAKKSWTQQRLLDAILSVKPEFLAEIAASKSIVALNSDYTNEISVLAARSSELEKVFRVLCFAR